MSVNKVFLTGRVGADPDVYSSDDRKVVRFSLATTESWKDKITGEKKEKTQWHKVVIYNSKTADFVQEYVKKGHLLYVLGKIEYSTWGEGEEKKTSANIVVDHIKGEVQILSSLNNSSSNLSNDFVGKPAKNNSSDVQADAAVQEDEFPF